MTVTIRSLKAYLFYTNDDLPVVKPVYDRLVWDSVDVHLSEFSDLEMEPEEFGIGSFWDEKREKFMMCTWYCFVFQNRFMNGPHCTRNGNSFLILQSTDLAGAFPFCHCGWRNAMFQGR